METGEEQTKQASNEEKALTDILKQCFDAGVWKTMNDQIVRNRKLQRQLKQGLEAKFQEAWLYIDGTDDLDIDTKRKLIKTLIMPPGKADLVEEFIMEAQIEVLLNAEEKMRKDGDEAGTEKAVTDILKLCFNAGAWKTMDDQIARFYNRQSQLKQAVEAMVSPGFGKFNMDNLIKTPKGGIKELLNVEEKMRKSGDVAGTQKAVADILEHCFVSCAWKLMSRQIVLISKHPGQFKKVVDAMVQQVTHYIDEAPDLIDLDTKRELITALDNMCPGKETGEGNLEAQIEALLNVEQQMRLAGYKAGMQKAVADILKLCFDAGAWKTMNDQIVLIYKRQRHLKQFLEAMIIQAEQYVDLTPDLNTRTELIKTLNNVSPGKASMNELIEGTEDLALEIFKRLGPEDSGRCLAVCKRWKGLIEPKIQDIINFRMDKETRANFQIAVNKERSNAFFLHGLMQDEETVLMMVDRFHFASADAGDRIQDAALRLAMSIDRQIFDFNKAEVGRFIRPPYSSPTSSDRYGKMEW